MVRWVAAFLYDDSLSFSTLKRAVTQVTVTGGGREGGVRGRGWEGEGAQYT